MTRTIRVALGCAVLLAFSAHPARAAYNIRVVAGSGLLNNSGAPGFTPTGNDSQVGADLIATQLGNGVNVLLDTGSSGSQAGTIIVNAPITQTSAGGASLTLQASSGVALNAAVDLSLGGSLAVLTGGAVAFGAATSVGGNLNVAVTGAISQSGALVVQGSSSFTTGSAPVTLSNVANDFTGPVQVTNSGANDVVLTAVNGLVLGNVTVGHNLVVTTGGPISQTTFLTVSGSASFDASGGPVTLTAGNLVSGAVSLQTTGPNGASYTGAGQVNLGTISVQGNLVVQANGPIVDTGVPVVVVGNTSLTPGPTWWVSVTNPGNIFSGTLSVPSASDVTVSTSSAPLSVGAVHASGAVAVTAQAITLSGTLFGGTSVAITTALSGLTETAGASVTTPSLQLQSASSGVYDLSQPANAIGTLTANLAGPLTVGNTGSIAIGAPGIVTGGNPVAITATGTITVNAPISTLPGSGGVVVTNGSVVLNAALTTGAGNITLNGAATPVELQRFGAE